MSREYPPLGRAGAHQGGRLHITEGTTKTDKPRLIDLGASTVAVLRAHRLECGGMPFPW